MTEVAALFVETDGPYFWLRHVDPWDAARDARSYPGTLPVVAHPPCQRWGRFWHGGPMRPHQFALGDDDGCFAAALDHVRWWGGILEHPAGSHAWAHFGLTKPVHGEGWTRADGRGGFTCYVEQGHYGHPARKATWLYAVGCDLPGLNHGQGEQRLPEYAVARYGYAKARRIGVMAAIGGKDKTAKRARTPERFRDLLIATAMTARA